MPWEYRIEKIKTSGVVVPNIDSLTAEDLNVRGKDDWELISCIPMNRGGGILEAVYLIFKRYTPEYLPDDPRLPGKPVVKETPDVTKMPKTAMESRWEAWHRRRDAAEAEGKPFDERPPSPFNF